MTDSNRSPRYVLRGPGPVPDEIRAGMDMALGAVLRIVYDALSQGLDEITVIRMLMRHHEMLDPAQQHGMTAWALIKLTLRDHPELER